MAPKRSERPSSPVNINAYNIEILQYYYIRFLNDKLTLYE